MSNRQNEINHVCFLIDGTRTFAIVNNVNAQKINDFAYSSGVPVLKDLIEATFVKRGIPYLSIALTLIGSLGLRKFDNALSKQFNLIPIYKKGLKTITTSEEDY